MMEIHEAKYYTNSINRHQRFPELPVALLGSTLVMKAGKESDEIQPVSKALDIVDDPGAFLS
jgi:hypothetical protein